jgi:hypothetical protein
MAADLNQSELQFPKVELPFSYAFEVVRTLFRPRAIPRSPVHPMIEARWAAAPKLQFNPAKTSGRAREQETVCQAITCSRC